MRVIVWLCGLGAGLIAAGSAAPAMENCQFAGRWLSHDGEMLALSALDPERESGAFAWHAGGKAARSLSGIYHIAHDREMRIMAADRDGRPRDIVAQIIHVARDSFTIAGHLDQEAHPQPQIWLRVTPGCHGG